MKKMKKFLVTVLLVAAAFAQAADAKKRDAYDIRPDAAGAKDAPTAVEWQNANGAALAAATADDVLAGFVSNEAAATALLAKLKGAYATDPIVAYQVGAVSQWVMGEDPCFLCFWKPNPSDGRKVWVKALLKTAETTKDDYIRTFCLDQLRWCGCKCPCVTGRIRKIGEASGNKAIKDFVAFVLRELEQ